MTSGWCRSCGAELADRAAFCSRCGSPVDAVPILPLVGDDVEPEAGATPDRRGSWRTLVGLVLAVVLVLVALSTLAGGDGEGDEAAEDESTTSTTQRSSTTRPPTTSRSTTTLAPGVTPPLLVDGEVLDPSYGMALVVVGDDSTVVVDLGTGEQLDLPAAPAGILLVAWTGEAVVAWSERELFRVDPTGGWEPVPTGDLVPQWMTATGAVTLHPIGESDEYAYGHIGPTGPLRLWPIDEEVVKQMFSSGGPVAVDGDRLLMDTFHGIYAADRRDGEMRRIVGGRFLGVGGGRLLTFGCDDRFSCRPSVHHLGSGASVDLPLPPAGIEVWTGGLSPDGEGVWIGGWDRTTGQQQRFVLVGDRWEVLGVTTTPAILGDAPVWSDDGDGLVSWSGGMYTVTATSTDAAGLAAPSEVRIARNVARQVFDGPGGGDLVVVVPLSGLPESWRP